jgi:hypothetical protein
MEVRWSWHAQDRRLWRAIDAMQIDPAPISGGNGGSFVSQRPNLINPSIYSSNQNGT